MTIGQLASAAGVNVQTIRYYERRGILPAPERTASGYRLYRPDSLRRLRFIRQAQRLGFSLTDIDELLNLRLEPSASCAAVETRTRRKLRAVRERMSELAELEVALERLIGACATRASPAECPILEVLDGPVPGRLSSRDASCPKDKREATCSTNPAPT